MMWLAPRLIRQWIARYRLQKMVERTRNSFEIQSFRKNRAAQIKRRAGA